MRMDLAQVVRLIDDLSSAFSGVSVINQLPKILGNFISTDCLEFCLDNLSPFSVKSHISQVVSFLDRYTGLSTVCNAMAID